MPLCNLNLLLA